MEDIAVIVHKIISLFCPELEVRERLAAVARTCFAIDMAVISESPVIIITYASTWYYNSRR